MVVIYTAGSAAPLAASLLGNPVSVQIGLATTASEAALSTAVAAETLFGAGIASEAAFGAAVAAESAATAASAVAATNIWNPVGWVIGAVAVGASQQGPCTMTWGCYKPIIGESETGVASTKPMLFSDLAAHPKVRRVLIGTYAGPTSLPDVVVENEGGESFLLQGVALPCGSVAYHARQCYELCE